MKGSRQDRYLIGTSSRRMHVNISFIPPLVGSPHAKGFRSPAEFAPHAFWLLNDPSLVNSNCSCKYCSKKPTRSVKRSEAFVSGPVPLPLPSRTRRISRTSSSLTHASQPSASKEARRLFRVAKVPIGLDPKALQPTLPITDGGSLYRKGEVVWLTLNKPVMLDYVDGTVDGFIIRFWPSIVEVGESHEEPLVAPPGHGTPTVTPLRVQLPFSGVVYDVPQHDTIPFWAHSPDELWLQRLRLQINKPLPGTQDPFRGFVRVHGSSPGETTLTFNTGDLLSHFLADIDTSLELTRSWSTTPMTHSSWPGVDLTEIPPRPSTIPSLYHELWWGAERIVLGDLLRLKTPESRLQGLGVGHMQFARRPLPEPSTEATTVGGSETEDGQLFFKLRCLSASTGINGKELHGFGSLYRLVPVDFGPLPPSTTDKEHSQPMLPCPPEGFAFQPILHSGWEVELSLHHIDGRYYPRIQELLPEPSGVDAHIMEVLEGIVRWRTPPLRPIHFKKGSREEIITQMVRGLQNSTEGGFPQA